MLKFLLEKEIKQMFRDKFMPRLLIAFPFLMMVFLPWAADMEIKNINLVVVDNSSDSFSRELLDKVSSSGYFNIVAASGTYDEAVSVIEYGDADIILEIPSDFEKNAEDGTGTVVNVTANSVNGTKAGLGSAYLSRVIASFRNDLNERRGIESGKEIFQVLYKFNDRMDYKSFMLPALMVMLMTMICGFLPALNVVTEKEKGTIEQVNVTPVNRFLFMLAKLIPYWIIGFLILNLCFLIAAVVYKLYPLGSFLTMDFFALIYLLGISGFGLIISNYSDNIQQAMFVMMFFIIIFILMSGLFTPVSSMPLWAQSITAVNPLTYFNVVMRGVYLKGAGISDLMPQLYALSIFAVLFNAWAVLSYKKRG